jgi:hypothetical protein
MTRISETIPDLADVNWPCLERAILTVSKPGGLKLGIHEVESKQSYSASYMPPRIDPRTVAAKRTMVLAG